jgi:hypothetical protein
MVRKAITIITKHTLQSESEQPEITIKVLYDVGSTIHVWASNFKNMMHAELLATTRIHHEVER